MAFGGSSFLPFLLISGYGSNNGGGNNCRGRERASDDILPLVLLAGSTSFTDNSLFPLVLLSGNNGIFSGNRRCRQRRFRRQSYQSVQRNSRGGGGYGGYGYDY